MRSTTINLTNSHYYRNLFSALVMLCLLLFADGLYAQCSGGQVFHASGSDRASICLNDANTVGLEVNNTSFAPTDYAYALTDINNQILSIHQTTTIQFDNLVEGTYYVYGFSFLGDLTAALGENVYNTRFSSSCWQISFNRVEVQLADPRESQVRTLDFQTRKSLCLNQGTPDFVSFQSIGPKTTPYIFLVVNDANQIIEVTSRSFSDFTNFPPGSCSIYGLAYTGNLLARFGMDISDNLATGCFQLSDDAIEVERAIVSGGDIFSQNFRAFEEFVTDDGQADRLDFTNSGSSLADYVYVLTDGANNVIQFLGDSSFDFEGLSSGTYRIWGFSYSGGIQINVGQSIFSGQFATGCFSRSFNALTVTAKHEGNTPPPCFVMAANISALSETIFCENSDIQSITTDADMGLLFETALILTDDQNTIRVISQEEEIQVANLEAGDYIISQIVFEQIDGLLVGSNQNNISGCFAQSNFISVQIISADSADCVEEPECLLTSSTLKADQETVCIEDIDNRFVTFEIDGVGSEENGILITDTDGNILELVAGNIYEVTEVGARIYYHINYESTVELFHGSAINELEGCFALSNSINITGIENCFTEPCELLPTSIFTSDNTVLCTTDASDDVVSLLSSAVSGEAQIYILTRQGEDEIISNQSSGEFVFSETMTGEFDIYLIDYNEPFLLTENINTLEGCFALSAPITISNALDNCIVEPSSCLNDGGQIVLNSDNRICGSDGQNDILDIDVSVSGGNNRVFLVVNENRQIVNIAAALVIIDNPFPNGVYDIYALSYDDFPVGLTINENLESFPDLCLSNSVTITVSDDFCQGSMVRGGSVSDEFGQDQVKFCTDVSGEVFTINLDNTGSIAFEYAYIETDENNIITNILSSNSIMYTADPTERMNSRIWGVSYTGNFAAFVGEDINSVALSDGSFDLSDNFISVEISVVIGENPIIVGAEAPFLEIPSGQEFTVDLESNMSSFLDYETAYILFDVDAVTIIDILYPDENFDIVLPELDTTPLTGELLTLTMIAYTGNILLEPGDQANSAFLPNATDVVDGCFDVADLNIAIRVFEDEGMKPQARSENVESLSSEEEISLRPNPVHERMEVSFPKSFVSQKSNLSIYSISGELVFKQNYSSSPMTDIIDVTNYPNGTYILQVYTDSSARSIKFLKI